MSTALVSPIFKMANIDVYYSSIGPSVIEERKPLMAYVNPLHFQCLLRGRFNICSDDVRMVFGENMLDYIINLIKGHIDYLPRLSDRLSMHILNYLSLDDLCRLSLVNKHFYQVTFSPLLFCDSSILYEMRLPVDLKKPQTPLMKCIIL